MEQKYAKIYSQHQAASNELKELQTALNRTHSDLEDAERELGIVQNERHQIQNEYSAHNSEFETLRQQYDELTAELEKARHDNRVSLTEADEELMKEQALSKELCESNEQLEEEITRLRLVEEEMRASHKQEMSKLEEQIRQNINNDKIRFEEDYKSKLREEQSEKKKMEQEIQSLYEQLESLKLRCSTAPSPTKTQQHRDSIGSNCSISSCSSSQRRTRKRPRDAMESDDDHLASECVEDPLKIHPVKKRKLTVIENENETENQNENENEASSATSLRNETCR